MPRTSLLVVVVALLLGMASPFVAGSFTAPEPGEGWNLFQLWFQALPVLLAAWLRPHPMLMFWIAVSIFTLQYLCVFLAAGALVRFVSPKRAPAPVEKRAFDSAAALFSIKDSW